MTKKLVYKDDHSIEIMATLEIMNGICKFHNADQLPDGTFELTYSGYTEILWNDQKTVKRDGQRVFLDKNGNEYLETELELIEAVDAE